jgi:flagellar basal body P-ring formation protein FlgA
MTRHALATSFARSRGGRALLHALCLSRGRNVRWHLNGICRELFGSRSSRLSSFLPPSLGLGWIAWIAASLTLLTQVGATVGAESNADPLTVRLLPLAQVDGSGVFLHQIVSGLEAGTAPVRVAAAPMFGRTMTLTRDQITAALGAARVDLAAAHWSGAETVRLTRRNRLLTESELKELLTATLQKEAVKDRGELELRLARPWLSVHVPDETLSLKILDLPTAGVSQHFVIRFELVAGEERIGPWQAVLQARILRNVLVATSTTRRGELLSETEVAVEQRDILLLRDPVEESALRGGALEFSEAVSAGQPILGRALRPRPILQRGMMVDGLMRDGSLQIILKVEVLADGLPGQLVRVRNPKTKREFYAKVKDEQTVLLNL